MLSMRYLFNRMTKHTYLDRAHIRTLKEPIHIYRLTFLTRCRTSPKVPVESHEGLDGAGVTPAHILPRGKECPEVEQWPLSRHGARGAVWTGPGTHWWERVGRDATLTHQAFSW